MYRTPSAEEMQPTSLPTVDHEAGKFRHYKFHNPKSLWRRRHIDGEAGITTEDEEEEEEEMEESIEIDWPSEEV